MPASVFTKNVIIVLALKHTALKGVSIQQEGMSDRTYVICVGSCMASQLHCFLLLVHQTLPPGQGTQVGQNA